MREIYEKLILAVKNDLTPSLGVTEPGAIAYASAAASKAIGGNIKSIVVRLNSGIYKNSFTCAVPGTGGVGCALAAALGAVAGDPEKKLTAIENVSQDDVRRAKELVASGAAKAELSGISPEIFIEAAAESENGIAIATVKDRHDNLVSLVVNGEEAINKLPSGEETKDAFRVSTVPFSEILSCVNAAENIEFLDDAVNMNMLLFEEGRKARLMPLTEARMLSQSDKRAFAEALTCGAIEARVRGASSPAMAITGSGSHGILCTLPIHAAAVFDQVDIKRERRALLLSSLVTMYIKELSGLLSTACGCVLAGGTGAALGIVYLFAEDNIENRLTDALNSMAASVTGMICHGGNTGCSLKAAIGVKMAFAAAEMALNGCGAERVHGILGNNADDTMRNTARIAQEMQPVENCIIDIMNNKCI